jgi:pimeloyl-ACP methyl ester carboxylesterase
MRQALFVQGGGEGVRDRWDDQLVDSLRSDLGAGWEIRYPVMSNEADPQYAVWRGALEKEPDRLPRDVPIFLYHGDGDGTVPPAHVELYACALPHAQVRRLAARDHQLGNDLSEIAADIRRLERNSRDIDVH